MMNWGIWNRERMRRGYPGAVVEQKRADALAGRSTSDVWVDCPDAPDVWQAGLDEVADLLSFYPHPNVTSFAFERISYVSSDFCYCPYTQAQYRQEMGKSLLDAAAAQIETWKKQHISQYLQRYVEHVKRLRPKLGVWLHTQCAPGWGHDPKRMQECGVDYLLPHAFHFQQSQAQFNQMLERLSPNKCVLHFSSRDLRPKNYPLWIISQEAE